MGRLTHLEFLDAMSVPVNDAQMAHLARLTPLRSLAIKGTPELTDSGLSQLAGLKHLESIHLVGETSIRGPGLAHLAGLKQLGYLRIGIKTHHGLAHLEQLTELDRLQIHLAYVDDEVIGHLARLTRLSELGFGSEAGSTSGLAPLRSLTNLKTLAVYGPWVDDQAIDPVAAMDHLETFFIADTTRVTAQGLYDLQQRRPSLRIVVNGTGQAPPAHLDELRRSVGPTAVPPGPAARPLP